MKLYVNAPTQLFNVIALVAVELSGQEAEMVVCNDEYRKTPAYKAMTTTDKFPMLQTEEGCIHETSAVAKYLCSLSPTSNLMGSTPAERSQVDQWISYSVATCWKDCYLVSQGIFGWTEVTQAEYNEAAKNVKAQFKIINQALEGKKWLVGNEMTLADVFVAMIFSYSL